MTRQRMPVKALGEAGGYGRQRHGDGIQMLFRTQMEKRDPRIRGYDR